MMTKLGRSASDLQREAVKNQYPPFCQEHTVKNCPKTVFLGVKKAVFSSLTKLLTFFPQTFWKNPFCFISILFYSIKRVCSSKLLIKESFWQLLTCQEDSTPRIQSLCSCRNCNSPHMNWNRKS